MKNLFKSKTLNFRTKPPFGQPDSGLPLSQLRSGDRAVVCRLNGGETFRSKMLSLGLFPGKTIAVQRSDKSLPFVLWVDQSRIVVDRNTLEQIYVQTVVDHGKGDWR